MTKKNSVCYLFSGVHIFQDGGRPQIRRPLVEGESLAGPGIPPASGPSLSRGLQVHLPERLGHLQAQSCGAFRLVALLQQTDGMVVAVHG